jgi:guanosine-3',5'-bis(diphosphate) 3'-pyrophosphohydrolase
MDVALLLTALEFAAAKHRLQRRKDAPGSPYVNHLIEVAGILANTGRVHDTGTLVAAILHDTLEDTATTAEELEREFGPETRAIVEEVSDDKRLPKAERKRLQVERAAALSAPAKLITLADKISNVRDVTLRPPPTSSLGGTGKYIEWTEQVVGRIRGTHAALEALYDSTLADARAALALRASDQPSAVGDQPQTRGGHGHE